MKTITIRAYQDKDDKKFYKVGDEREIKDEERAEELIKAGFVKCAVVDYEAEVKRLTAENEALKAENAKLKAKADKDADKEAKAAEKAAKAAAKTDPK